MEEEKKEECCQGKSHHHKCCDHKLPKLVILLVGAFFIFSLGFWAGSDSRQDWRSERDFDGRGFGRMMDEKDNFQKGGCRFSQDEDLSAGCPMMRNQAQADTISVSPTCPMQATITTNNSAPVIPAKTVTPIK